MNMGNHGGMMMFVHHSFLAVLPARSFGSKQEEWAKGIIIWPCKVFFFICASDFLHTVKSYDMALLRPEGRYAADLYHP
jgi:hypothetical protein